LSKTATNLRDGHAALGVVNDNIALSVANDTRPVTDNFEQRQERVYSRRDRVLILLALHRRLEDIYPKSVEAVEIRALIDRLSNGGANED
jgi:hypothetical protein